MRIVKKYVFLHFEPKKGVFWGYKQVWPPSFLDRFYAKKKFRGYLLAPQDQIQNSEMYIFSEII